MTLTAVSVANLIIAVAGVMICAFSILLTFRGIGKERLTPNYFAVIFSSMLIYNICLGGLELAGLLPSDSMWVPWIRVAGFLTYFLSVFSAFVFTEYVIAFWEKSPVRNKTFHFLAGAFMTAGTFILIAEQLRGHLISVNPDGTYLTGHAHFLGYQLVAVFMIMSLMIGFMHRRDFTSQQRLAFLLYVMLPLISIVVRRWIPGVYLVALASSLSLMIMLNVAIYEHTEAYREQEIRNAQLKVDLMLGQIQPQFLYSVLYEIQEICKKDPDTATLAIRNFSLFMRHNMESISINTPIPFREELDHVMLYISLQKLRFGDSIKVIYDLTSTAFSLPTLTLQPVVQNAIRYGIRKNEDGAGTITISTTEYNDRFEVEVNDDGPGLPPESYPDDGMARLDINNIRDRLRLICGGDLRVEMTPGKGTTVTLVLPK